MMGFTRKFKPLEILPESEVDAIHKNTLHVLETVGVKFESKKALALFKKAGCKVDETSMAVRFPPSLVEECLKQCPTSFSLKARDPDNSLHIGEDVMHFYNSVGLRHVDLSTWEPRAATMKEQDDGVRVLDALENLHVVNMYTPYMEIEGAHLSMLMLESLASRIRNTTKVIVSAYSNDSEIFAIEMAKALELELLGCVMIAPPLRYYPDACEAAFRYVEAGFPIFITSGVSFGATGPVTTAGSTITNNAELLAGLVLVQLIRPGTGVIAANFAFPMDMKTAMPVFGSLGSSLHTAMFGQIWRRYQIPTCVSSSGYVCAKKPDFQSAYEKTFAALIAALSGINVVSLHGGVYAELSYHPLQSVMDDDIASLIGNFLESVDINDTTMAMDVIAQVGQAPEHYLGTMHTFDNWRKEHHQPDCADRFDYEKWIANDKKTAMEIAKIRLDEILENHRLSIPFPDEYNQSIADIFKEARKFYGI